jgi:hypothetical protein
MLKEGITLHGQVGDRVMLAQFLEALAMMASSRGEAERSALLLGAAEGLLLEVGAPGYNFHEPGSSLKERAVTEAGAVLGETAFEEARERGREMIFEQVVEYALEDDEPLPR